ncbi:MAG TPA: hypothetical protein VEB86_00090 [Chryseosolibacter sp.]|nr:hypothetical protein [Chryseosolibacter sp.]
MNFFKVLLLLAFGFVFLASCEKRPVRPPFPDPLAQAFLSKRLKMAVVYDADVPQIADSIWFDRKGNVVREKTHGRDVIRAFDSLHFITRELIKGEFYTHFLVEYRVDNGLILQEWYPIKSFKWAYSASDVSKKYHKVVKFKLDSQGRISEEIDEQADRFTVYSYDSSDKSRLKSKAIHAKSSGQLLQSYRFEYEGSTLQKAQFDIGGSPRWRYYLSKRTGLVDSAIYGENDVKKYEYFFY